jgi:uncharacterized protein YdgA (DUF945 family)
MNEIKKYAAIGGGIAVIACWPLVVGQIGQNLIHDHIASASNANLSVELVSFDRGYLSSHLVSKIAIVDTAIKTQFEADNVPTEWYLDTDIDHNLLTLDAVTHFRDYPNIPFQVLTKSTLSGDTHVDAELGQFDYAFVDSIDDWTMSMQPAHLVADVTLEEMISASFTMAGIKMTNQSGEFVALSDLHSRAQGKMQQNLWIGEQTLSIASIEAGSPEDESLSLMEGFSYSMNATRVDAAQQESQSTPALYNSHTKIYVGKVISSEQQIDDITLDVVAGDFDADNLNVIIDVLQSDTPKQAENQMIAAVDALVQHGLFMNIERLGFSYLNQPIDAKIKLSILAGTENISQAPMTLLNVLKGDVFVQVPKALVEQVPNLQQGIDQLRSKEYIVETDANFEFSATIEGGNVVFSNGQKTPLIAALVPLFMR